MKKIKVGPSFFILIVVCLVTNNLLILLNYFLALMFHELAHLYTAIKCGYGLKQFKISMFGFSVELGENINPNDAFVINIAGPMCNFFLCICCLAMYQLLPNSYEYLNVFCAANLVLAIFNLLPIYPLDGGKIFQCMFSNQKVYKTVDLIVRYVLSIVFIILFILSGFEGFNWFYLMMFVFLLFSKKKEETTFSLFKYKNHKKVEKVEILRVSEELSLYELLKKINTKKYTIFYCSNLKQKYVDEDMLVDLATHHPLTLKMKQISNVKQIND